MKHTVLLLFSLLAISLPCRADEKELAAKLEEKGMRLRKEAAGSVTEISFSSDVTMTREDYQSFSQFPKLHKLWMSPGGLRLNDETLTAMGALPNLDYFFGGSAQFSDDGLKGFAQWKNLKYFGLDHWFGPEGSKDYFGKGLAHLAGLPLESVRLGGCRVDDEAPRALAKIKTLEKVDLFHTARVTDEGVAALQALPKLKIVILGPQFTPRITDRSLELLSHIPTLEVIDITGTWLTHDGGFTHLKKLPNLKTLKLKMFSPKRKTSPSSSPSCQTSAWSGPPPTKRTPPGCARPSNPTGRRRKRRRLSDGDADPLGAALRFRPSGSSRIAAPTRFTFVWHAPLRRLGFAP